jgi:hypothetical protein
VNPHTQLIWQSLFAPTAAVDLAKQHPDTWRLGWIYVVASIIVSFVCELIARFVIRPAFNIVVAENTDAWAWFDTIPAAVVFSIIATVLLFLGQRLFWRAFDANAAGLKAIDAGIIAGFALSIAITLPQYILTELTQNSTGFVLFTMLAAQITVYIGFSTVYFSHAMNMSLGKSFALNWLVFILIIFASLLLCLLFFIVMSVFNGTSFDVLFGNSELTP